MLTYSVFLWLIAMIVALPVCVAYPSGPPVTITGMCKDMIPTGHGAAAQPLQSVPFEIVTNSDCYSPNMEIQVVMRTKSGKANEIEGLFLQARRQSGSNTDVAVGTYKSKDRVLSPLPCNNMADSTLGHNKEKESTFREAVWTAPASGVTEDIKFRATVVEHKETFWVGVQSKSLTFNVSCVAGDKIRKSSAAARFHTQMVYTLAPLGIVYLLN